jgi:hypothetical protein
VKVRVDKQKIMITLVNKMTAHSATPRLLEAINQIYTGDNHVLDLLLPLLEASEESSTLVIGYSASKQSIRSELIPYFHVVGRRGAVEPLRVLVVGGLLGTDRLSVYILVSLIAGLENRLRLVDGLEVTAYPAVNVEALRTGDPLTGKQQLEGLRLWTGSACSHVRVLEQEMLRYPYDLVISVRERPVANRFDVAVWPSGEQSGSVLSDSLERLSVHSGSLLAWKVAGMKDRLGRMFTPVPAAVQPSEVVVDLPSGGDPRATMSDASGLLLTLMHAARQARAEGVV